MLKIIWCEVLCALFAMACETEVIPLVKKEQIINLKHRGKIFLEFSSKLKISLCTAFITLKKKVENGNLGNELGSLRPI